MHRSKPQSKMVDPPPISFSMAMDRERGDDVLMTLAGSDMIPNNMVLCNNRKCLHSLIRNSKMSTAELLVNMCASSFIANSS